MWQDKLKEIIYLLENSDVNEIDIKFWGRRFRVVKSAGINAAPEVGLVETVAAAPKTPPHQVAPTEISEGKPVASGEEILSPMPGTFYTASSPDVDPFVKVGDTVKEGDTLCIIEAMKIMNEIEAEKSGTITKVLVENGNAVEYNQQLFLIDPS